jgi:hypothetical protein
MWVTRKQQRAIEKERTYMAVLRLLQKERRAVNRRIKAIETAQKKAEDNWRAEMQRMRAGVQHLGPK